MLFGVVGGGDVVDCLSLVTLGGIRCLLLINVRCALLLLSLSCVVCCALLALFVVCWLVFWCVLVVYHVLLLAFVVGALDA